MPTRERSGIVLAVVQAQRSAIPTEQVALHQDDGDETDSCTDFTNDLHSLTRAVQSLTYCFEMTFVEPGGNSKSSGFCGSIFTEE